MTSPDPQRPSEELEPLPILEPRPEGSGVAPESWEHESDTRRNRPGWWLYLLIPAGIASLSWAWMVLSVSHDHNQEPGLPDDFQSSTASSLPVPVKHEAEALIQAYVQADTVEALLKTVHQPERVRPLVDAYPWVPRSFESLELLARREHGDVNYHIAQALTQNGIEESFVLLHTLRDSWRIDWETQVVYNPHSWAAMIEKSPTDPVILRVRAAPGTYYNYRYSNPRTHLCVELREPKGDGILYGYIDKDKDTVQSQPLMRLLDQGQEAPLMVTVQFPKEGESEGQATILAFLQEGWLRL